MNVYSMTHRLGNFLSFASFYIISTLVAAPISEEELDLLPRITITVPPSSPLPPSSIPESQTTFENREWLRLAFKTRHPSPSEDQTETDPEEDQSDDTRDFKKKYNTLTKKYIRVLEKTLDLKYEEKSIQFNTQLLQEKQELQKKIEFLRKENSKLHRSLHRLTSTLQNKRPRKIMRPAATNYPMAMTEISPLNGIYLSEYHESEMEDDTEGRENDTETDTAAESRPQKRPDYTQSHQYGPPLTASEPQNLYGLGSPFFDEKF